MNIEVVAKEGLKRELNIEVPVEIVNDAFDKVYDEYRRNAKIKGFRPGKVPVKIIRNRFKREATADVVDDLVNKYFSEALEEKKLEPVGKPVLSNINIDEGKPLTFTIGIEVMPELQTIVYDNLLLEDIPIKVPDEDIDQVVERLRKSAAEIRSVNRPSDKTDILICDLEVLEGEVDTTDAPLQNQEIDLENEYTIKEFREELLGLRREETRDVKIAYPEDYPDKLFAGKSIAYKVNVKEVKERVLPPLNDQFVKLTGLGETLLELRLNIRKRIEQEIGADLARAYKMTIINQIVQKNPMDVPEAMVETYVQGIIEDLTKDGEKFDEKEAREKYRQIGINAVRWYLLHHRLAVQEKIEVSTEDTEKWIKRFAENYRMDVPKAKELLAKTGRADEIKDGILEEKVVDFLLSKAERIAGTTKHKEGNT